MSPRTDRNFTFSIGGDESAVPSHNKNLNFTSQITMSVDGLDFGDEHQCRRMHGNRLDDSHHNRRAIAATALSVAFCQSQLVNSLFQDQEPKTQAME